MAVILLYARQLIHVELNTHTVSRPFLEGWECGFPQILIAPSSLGTALLTTDYLVVYMSTPHNLDSPQNIPLKLLENELNSTWTLNIEVFVMFYLSVFFPFFCMV